MQAIRTRYHGPGNVRGSRVSAQCEAGRIYLEWDDALNSEQNHIAAATYLAAKLGWIPPHYGEMVTGCFDGDFYHVFPDKSWKNGVIGNIYGGG